MDRLQTQPDKASCFITCVAMIIGEPVEELIKKINGDVDNRHLHILHPGRQGGLKFRGHHPQDIQPYLNSIDWCMITQYFKVPFVHAFYDKKCYLCGGTGKFKGKYEDYDLEITDVGILQYWNHDCAWIDGKVYNPSGKIDPMTKTGLVGFHPFYKINR